MPTGLDFCRLTSGCNVVQYKLVVLIASTALAALFAGGAMLSLQQHDDRLKLQLETQAVRMQSIYEVSMDELEHEARALAYNMAADPEIAHILGEANHLLRAGGESNDARAVELRAALTAKLDLQWQDMHRMFDLRQLQFLLTPDLRSFLRLHAPERYGDSLMELRPMIRSIQNDRIPRSGFEIGRAFAGIRGGAPVIRPYAHRHEALADAPQAGETGEHVGTLEVGIGLDGLLKRLSEKLDIGVAVLLNPERVTQAMWSLYQPATRAPERSNCCFLLSASRPEAEAWLAAGLIERGKTEAESRLQTWDRKQFQVIRFPLFDFVGKQNPARPPAGSILIWRNAETELAANTKARSITLRNAFAGYALVQLIVLLLLNLSRREWKRQLDLQTAAISRLSQQNALLLNTAGEGIYGVDPNGVTSFINPAALTMLGCTAAQVIGENQHRLFHHHYADGSPYPDEACPIFQTLLDGKRRSCEDWFIRADGTAFPVAVTVAPIDDGNQRDGAVVVFRDISELKEQREALEQLATTDPLTGASNRRQFLEWLDNELSRLKRKGGTASILMADLDHFKNVNDTHGHAAGDAVLKHFVDIVRQTLRKTDVIGRLGGEEFAILLPGDGIEGARELAERLCEAVKNSPSRFERTLIPISVSIGVASLNTRDDSAEASLRRADKALYDAKHGGRDQVRIHTPGQSDAGLTAPEAAP